MERYIVVVLSLVMLIGVVHSTDILYSSDIEVEGAPSITCVDDNFYISWLEDDGNIFLAKVKFRLSGDQIPVLLKKNISNSGEYYPDLANFKGDSILMGWVHDDNKVFIELYDPEDLETISLTKYTPSAEGPVSVFQYGDYLLNTWVSSEKPGLTFILTNPKSDTNILDERYNQYKPDDNTGSITHYKKYLYTAWYEDEKVHVTRVKMDSAGTDCISDYDVELEGKTNLPPAIFAAKNGIMFVAWADSDEDNIFVQGFDVKDGGMDSVLWFDIPVDGCNGLDITVVDRTLYVAYSDGDGHLNVQQMKK